MRPIWEKIQKNFPKLNFRMLDIDENEKEITEFGITEDVLPVAIIKNSNGKEIKRIQGELSKSKIVDIINELNSD